jgi:tRNA dimethylallyltransferase
MVENGVIDEIKPLEAMDLDIALPAATAHGVPEIRHYLRKTMSLEEAVEQAQRNTRHYIKRQFTWFRGQMKNAIELTQSPYEIMSRSIDEFLLTKCQ